MADYLDATVHPGHPQVDVKASMVGDLGDRQSMVGRSMRYGETEFIVDSVSDLGDGWWRFRLISPE
jgi:hypothetical protein